ncbi:MAG TPA: site-2 protease family protein [Vicinamibacterales bacterium]|jgi:Zn-dependent protease|nr:site-2 protease family protein [Vicinamibacterales bacterium]
MSRSFRLARLAGIDIFVHPTFALLLVWVAASSGLQGRTVGAAAEGVALMLALFGCIVLHELGHALMARRFGIATKDITLLPIGGMARLERMPERPVQEFLVALAGPAVTLLIAVVLFAWLRVSGDWRPLEAISVGRGAFVEQIMVANVALLLFNLLPAFPMDGGRVLRAVLAARTDYVSATVRAASIGQGIAFLLALVGLFSNLFLVVVAFFIWIAAGEEAAAVQKRSALAGVTVRAAMMTQLQTLTPASTLGDAVELLLSGSQQDFPVLQRGALAGMLTRQRLIGALASHGREAAVGPLMEESIAVTPDELLEPMLTRLDATNTRSIAVVDEGRLVGLVTLDNVGELLMVRAADHRGGAPPVS